MIEPLGRDCAAWGWGTPSISSRNLRRPRERRDLTVPTGTPSRVAATSYRSPSRPTRVKREPSTPEYAALAFSVVIYRPQVVRSH